MKTLADATASVTLPDSSSLLSQTTSGEIVLFIVGVVFTLALLTAFVWITFRASREKA